MFGVRTYFLALWWMKMESEQIFKAKHVVSCSVLITLSTVLYISILQAHQFIFVVAFVLGILWEAGLPLCVCPQVYMFVCICIHAWNKEDGGTNSLCAILYDSLKTVVSCDIMNTGVSCGIIHCDVLNTRVACNMKTNKCLTTFTFKHVCCLGITLLAAESFTWCTYMRQNTTTTPVHAQRTSGDACTPRTLKHISHPCI